MPRHARPQHAKRRPARAASAAGAGVAERHGQPQALRAQAARRAFPPSAALQADGFTFVRPSGGRTPGWGANIVGACLWLSQRLAPRRFPEPQPAAQQPLRCRRHRWALCAAWCTCAPRRATPRGLHAAARHGSALPWRWLGGWQVLGPACCGRMRPTRARQDARRRRCHMCRVHMHSMDRARPWGRCRGGAARLPRPLCAAARAAVAAWPRQWELLGAATEAAPHVTPRACVGPPAGRVARAGGHLREAANGLGCRLMAWRGTLPHQGAVLAQGAMHWGGQAYPRRCWLLVFRRELQYAPPVGTRAYARWGGSAWQQWLPAAAFSVRCVPAEAQGSLPTRRAGALPYGAPMGLPGADG